MRKPLFMFTLVCLITFAVAACTMKATPTQDPAVVLAKYNQALAYFNQIEIGMTYDQVGEIIGVPGVQSKDKPTPSNVTQSIPAVPRPPGYTWNFDSKLTSIYYLYGESFKLVTGTKIFSADLFDLAFRVDAVSSDAQYKKVENGMTYDQVKAMMGSSGRLFRSEERILPGPPKMVTSKNGLPSARQTTIITNLNTYIWWTDGADLGADMLFISFKDGKVAYK